VQTDPNQTCHRGKTMVIEAVDATAIADMILTWVQVED
jgi:hypothetical protein